jgi:hypothetical protein
VRIRFRIHRFWRRRDGRDPGGLPPAPRGQRLLVAGAAIAITLVIGAGLLMPHIEFLRHRQTADALKPCAPGQTRNCVGGTMRVIVTPASSPSP